MNTRLYFEVYQELLDRGSNKYDARCLMSDLEEAVEEDPNLDVWKWIDDN